VTNQTSDFICWIRSHWPVNPIAISVPPHKEISSLISSRDIFLSAVTAKTYRCTVKLIAKRRWVDTRRVHNIFLHWWVGRIAHKAGNYPSNDVMAKPNLYSGFPIMQFISPETSLAGRNNGFSSKLLRCSTPLLVLFLLLLLLLLLFVLHPSPSLSPSSSTVSPHSFPPLHLYGWYTTISTSFHPIY